MGSFIDLTGQQFGRLTVLERDKTKKGKATFWKCQCSCGNITIVKGGNLRNGHTKSCGCFKRETEASHFLNSDHLRGENPRLASIWKSMKHRCYRKENKQYHNYGGRGIRICDEWLLDDGFKNFVEWAKGNGYKDNLCIDRIDVNGNYEPNNCRWVTVKENANNRRDNRYIKYNGVTKTLAQWSEEYGLSQRDLKRRLDILKLPIETALVMDGLPKAEYNGKILSIRHLSGKYHIDYVSFLHDYFVTGKSAEEIVKERAKQ